MKRTALFVTASVVMLGLGAFPVFAQRGGGGGGGRGGGGMGGGNQGSMGNQRDPYGQRGQKSQNQTSNKASTDLQKNNVLAKKLEDLLPNTDAQSASRGFSSLGDLMAAAHASKNLDIPFAGLKKQVTGSKKLSLEKAIIQAKSSITPDDAKQAAKTAKQQGDQDIKASKAELKAAQDAEKKNTAKK